MRADPAGIDVVGVPEDVAKAEGFGQRDATDQTIGVTAKDGIVLRKDMVLQPGIEEERGPVVHDGSAERHRELPIHEIVYPVPQWVPPD